MISNDEADGNRLEPLSTIHANSQSSIVAAAGHGDCVSRFCEAESADRAEQDYWMSSTPVLKYAVDAASDEFPGSGVPILTPRLRSVALRIGALRREFGSPTDGECEQIWTEVLTGKATGANAVESIDRSWLPRPLNNGLHRSELGC